MVGQLKIDKPDQNDEPELSIEVVDVFDEQAMAANSVQETQAQAGEPVANKIGRKARGKAKKVLMRQSELLGGYLWNHAEILDDEEALSEIATFWGVWREDIQPFVEEAIAAVAEYSEQYGGDS